MFAGAAFTDQADIKVDSEVVDTLVSLGVINGYTDGSFKPNDTVTRAEMAKMIYVLRTGNSDASAYNNDKTTFTDINGHWARGYVKYCQSLGIIAGQSATTFAPDQTVTAQEAAKMLLVTLGYDAQKAGLVGINWASKTNALADENGLLEDVTTSFTGPCPRQYAAQLMYNAIDASTVVWRDDAYTKYNYNGDENPTIGEKYMGLKYATGILMASGKVGLDNTGASKALVVKADEKQTVLNTKYEANDLIKFTDIKTDYSEFLGMAVKVMYKDKDKVYGVYATDDNDVNIAALAYDQDGSDYTLFVLDKNYFKAGDVKVAAKDSDVVYNDKTETFSGTEAEDAAPIFISYKDHDSYKVITGSALKNYDKMTGQTGSVVLADDDNVVAAYIDLKGGLSNTDTLYGVVKKSYSGTESDGTDTVIYLDMITSEGLKTVETEETGKASKFTKGMIVSFTGTYEKANDDITVVSSKLYQKDADNTEYGFIAISNDWSDSSKLVRSYDVYSTKGDASTKIASIAGKVVSDSVVINIDEDNYKADDATPSKAEELSNGDGYYANAFVIVNDDNEIELLVYETANRIKDNGNNEIKLYTK